MQYSVTDWIAVSRSRSVTMHSCVFSNRCRRKILVWCNLTLIFVVLFDIYIASNISKINLISFPSASFSNSALTEGFLSSAGPCVNLLTRQRLERCIIALCWKKRGRKWACPPGCRTFVTADRSWRRYIPVTTAWLLQRHLTPGMNEDCTLSIKM